MPDFKWNEEKNKWLKKERGISFEEVVNAIENKNLLDTINNPSPKYPHQEIYIVAINDYAYAVPVVESEKEIFMKTIIPHRVYTKKY